MYQKKDKKIQLYYFSNWPVCFWYDGSGKQPYQACNAGIFWWAVHLYQVSAILDLNLGDTWGEKKETSKGVGVKLKEE